MSPSWTVWLLVLATAGKAGAPGASGEPDLVLHHGRVFTGVAAHPWVEALATVPPPDLPKTESVLTLVGGKVAYDAGVLPR